MAQWRRSFGAVAVVLAAVGTGSETAWAACDPVVTEAAAGEVVINWCGGAPVTGLRLARRVDERMAVSITSHHFNFLHYGIDYKVEDKVVDAYVTLDKLWSQVFHVAGLVEGVLATERVSADCGDFNACVVSWLWALQVASISVDEAIGAHAQAGPGLTDDAVRTIAAYAATDVPRHLAGISKARQKVLKLEPATADEIEIFTRAEAEHAKIVDKLTAFRIGADLVENGQRRFIDKRKAGTLVTVTLTPRSRFEGADGGAPLSVEYFVHSRFPVTYHMGYAYSRLKDVEFEPVRALSGQDLFARVKDEPGVTAVTALLSYPLKTWPATETKGGVYATLGTDVGKPGDRLYGGLSVRLASRFLLNVGVATATVEEGGNEILEKVGDRLETRELFDAVITRRAWKPFVGISVAVF